MLSGGDGDDGAEGGPLDPALQEFFERYPCDMRAVAFLTGNDEAVIERVLRDFRPKREGETDYSALLVAFVKNVKATSNGAAEPQSLERDLEEFRQRYPMDEDAFNYLFKSQPEVQRIVLRDFRPKQEGESDYSALIIKFTKRIRETPRASSSGPAPLPHPASGGGYAPSTMRGASVITPVPHPQHGAAGGAARGNESLEVELTEFRLRYPIDDEAYAYLINSPLSVQEKVIREFRAKQEGQSDYSALLIAFAKRLRTATIHQQVPANNGAHVSYGGKGIATHYAPVADPRRQLLAELDGFRRRYPLDEDAYNYILKSSVETQRRVLRQFKPRVEGEADYSALVIGFTKRVRQSLGDNGNGGGALVAAAPASVPTPAAPPTFGANGGYGGNYGPSAVGYPQHAAARGGGWGPYGGPPTGHHSGPPARQTVPQLRAPDLTAFRNRFPMDDRAMKYLQESAVEVQWQIVETFSPKRLDDTDFSAPLVAYAKMCRSRAPGVAPAGPDLDSFCRQYPVDQRALDYVRASPPEVIERVVREFRPKREGESDYSAAVVAFTKKCGGGHGTAAPQPHATIGFGGGPWQQPAYGGPRGYGCGGGLAYNHRLPPHSAPPVKRPRH